MNEERAPWPARLLDVPRLRAQGVRPVPFRQFVLKVHGRCNLACAYCYVYASADQGWRRRRDGVSERTIRQAAYRIGEHAATHDLREVDVVLHGGEPLLSGVEPLLAYLGAIRDRVPPGCTVRPVLQTNGTLLTEERIHRLAEAGVRIGVSLDGGLARHNTARVDHAGRPAWDEAARGLRLLAGFPEAYAGVLCTIDVRQDPVEVYESLLGFHPPAMDLLLPHGNWTTPPPGRAPGSRAAPYGDWLCAVFDRWWDAGRRRTRLRLFEESLALLLGTPGATEALGTLPVTAVVVESDGSIEQVDSLKSAYDGAASTGCDIFSHAFDDVLDHPGIAARHLGVQGLSDSCRACPVGRVCGGGHYAHRYREGSGFRNPSVYCTDLERFIRHAAARLEGAATVGAG